MTKGVLLFAYDNGVFPYHELPTMCAWFIKRHLGVPVTVVTDEKTKALIEKEPGAKWLIDDYIIFDHTSVNGDRAYTPINGRRRDATHGEFKNNTRVHAYDLTPYDETILMDLDYIVLDDSLSAVWGSSQSLRLNHHIDGILPGSNDEPDYLHPLGIAQYWSTVMYFRKTEETKIFYEGMKYIHDNYEYMAKLYRHDPQLFRIDHAVSIMTHIMTGWTGRGGLRGTISELPDNRLLFAWDKHPIVGADADSVWFDSNPWDDSRARFATRSNGRSVHCMNKDSLIAIMKPWVDEQVGG